jgi:hypothetical protein
MPREKLTEEERKQRKREAFKRYYEANREVLVAKMADRYNPERRREYYEENAEHIRAYMRQHYKDKRSGNVKERLEELKASEAVPEALKPIIDHLITNDIHSKLYPAELTLLENLLIYKGKPVENAGSV